MHQYLTRQMVARKPLSYCGRELSPGDGFVATPVDGDYFIKGGFAEDIGAPELVAVAHVAAPKEFVLDPTKLSSDAPYLTEALIEVTPAAKPSDGLTVAELKAKLTEKGIAFPSGFVPKAELAALLDAA